MSSLSRKLKRQFREMQRWANAPILIRQGFGRDNLVIVKPRFLRIRLTKGDEVIPITFEDHQISELWTSIEDFDDTATPDIEFAGDYNGKFRSRYNRQCKRQLVEVAETLRQRIDALDIATDVQIVVYWVQEWDSWALDVYNHDKRANWVDEASSRPRWF